MREFERSDEWRDLQISDFDLALTGFDAKELSAVLPAFLTKDLRFIASLKRCNLPRVQDSHIVFSS